MEQFIEKYVKIPPKQRYAAIAMVVVLLFAGYWYLYYDAASQKLTQLQTKYRALEAERAEKQAYVDNLPKYEARLVELQQDLNVARAQLPDSADVPQLLAQLGNKGRQSGLTIDRFQPRGEKAKDFVAEISFAVKVRGSFHEVATFIDSVGKLDRIINVTDLSMRSPKLQNQKMIVNSEFSIKTFRFAPSKAKKKKK